MRLSEVQERLLERLFADCARVEVLGRVAAGATGSHHTDGGLTLQTEAYDRCGRRLTPTLTKLDRQQRIVREVVQAKRAHSLGAQTAKVLGEPSFELGTRRKHQDAADMCENEDHV